MSLTPDILPVVNTLDLKEIGHAFALFKGTYSLLTLLSLVAKFYIKLLSNRNRKRGESTVKQMKQHSNKSIYINF